MPCRRHAPIAPKGIPVDLSTNAIWFGAIVASDASDASNRFPDGRIGRNAFDSNARLTALPIASETCLGVSNVSVEPAEQRPGRDAHVTYGPTRDPPGLLRP